MPEDNKPAEKQDHDLEQILEAFDQIKDVFHSPRTLSYEHDDVTVKYWNSMLGLAEEKGTERESIVSSFCQRFDANQEQMEDLLSNNHNWVDYNLYHAFSAHCQQQLGMDTEKFWENVVDITFQDYSDKQIAVARRIPLKFTIKEMNKQFKNWSKVNEIKVEELERSRNSYVIKKKTLPEAQQRTEQLIGKEALDMLLRRDDHYTHCSFTTTFQKLYNQPNLYLDQGHSEADGNEWSEHYVHPSSPHRFKTVENFYSFLSSLKSFGRNCKTYFLPWLVNKELKNAVFEQEQTISESKRHLELTNAKLERRQETIMDLLSNISEIRMTGERHAIRGTLDKAFEEDKKEIMGFIAQQINFVYDFYKDNSSVYEFLVASCEPFGIKSENLSDPETIYNQLRNVTFNSSEKEKKEEKNETSDQEDLLEEFDLSDMFDIFDEIVKKDVHLDSAFEQFNEIKKQYHQTLNENNLDNFDPFRLLITLKGTQEKMDSINRRISKMGEVGFLDEVKLSAAAEEGINQAKIEKRSDITINLKLDYDPVISTNKDALVYMIKDIVSNMIDHGKASEGTIVSRLPTKVDEKDYETELPYYDLFNFNSFPVLYLGFSDNGNSISPEKATEINQYITSGIGETKNISSKKEKTGENESGFGTKNLHQISGLHDIKVHYAPSKTGTTIDCYFGRLEI